MLRIRIVFRGERVGLVIEGMCDIVVRIAYLYVYGCAI